MKQGIPLVGVLSLQIIVVFAAFAAVIAVLSIQQEREFKDALFKQLTLQQDSAATDIMAPLLERSRQFDILISIYSKFLPDGGEPGTGYKYTMPHGGSTFASGKPFFDVFYAQTDPLISSVIIANRSKRLSKYHLPDVALSQGLYEWDIFLFDPMLLAIATKDIGVACLGGSYPFQLPPGGPCSSPWLLFTIPVDTTNFLGVDMRVPKLWTRPVTIYSLQGIAQQTIAYMVRINSPVDNETHVALITLKSTHIKPIIVRSSPTPQSVTALFSSESRPNVDFDVFFVSGIVGFNDTILPEDQVVDADININTWRGGRTPDPILNLLYSKARGICGGGTRASQGIADDNPCESTQVIEIRYNNKDYTASATRIARPESRLDWLLVQYTPREEFFGASDRSRTTGIVIGVVGALVVLATCVLIWLAIYSPLRRLRDNMALAAEMRNEEVVVLDPLLMEMSDLVDAFGQMNTKLLRARPFLPQSLLCGEDVDLGEEESSLLDGESGNEHLGPEASQTQASSNLNDTRDKHQSRHDDSAGTSSSAVDTASHYESIAHASLTPNVSKKKGTETQGGGGVAIGARTLVRNKTLESRRVGVLSINVCGFANATAALGQIATAKTHAALTKLVESAVGEERGIVDYFHGDRFVCGFNTARMCANVGAAGGQAAVKLWERFCADPALSGAFPKGLSMGLSTGRALVGNHGSDSMQRLGTLGQVFTEAMRLQEAMSRRVLVARDDNGGTPDPDDTTPFPRPSNNLPNFCPSLLGGRCLVMGRTLQDVDTALTFQVVGAVPASELMPSSESKTTSEVENFARTKNKMTWGLCLRGEAAEDITPIPLSAVTRFIGGDVSKDSLGTANGAELLGIALPTTRALPLLSTMNTCLVAVLCESKCLQKSQQKSAAAAGDMSDNKGDEWLYELQLQEQNSPFSASNANICRLWASGRCVSSSAEDGAKVDSYVPLDNVKRVFSSNFAGVEKQASTSAKVQLSPRKGKDTVRVPSNTANKEATISGAGQWGAALPNSTHCQSSSGEDELRRTESVRAAPLVINAPGSTNVFFEKDSGSDTDAVRKRSDAVNKRLLEPSETQIIVDDRENHQQLTAAASNAMVSNKELSTKRNSIALAGINGLVDGGGHFTSNLSLPSTSLNVNVAAAASSSVRVVGGFALPNSSTSPSSGVIMRPSEASNNATALGLNNKNNNTDNETALRSADDVPLSKKSTETMTHMQHQDDNNNNFDSGFVGGGRGTASLSPSANGATLLGIPTVNEPSAGAGSVFSSPVAPRRSSFNFSPAMAMSVDKEINGTAGATQAEMMPSSLNFGGSNNEKSGFGNARSGTAPWGSKMIRKKEPETQPFSTEAPRSFLGGSFVRQAGVPNTQSPAADFKAHANSSRNNTAANMDPRAWQSFVDDCMKQSPAIAFAFLVYI